MWYDEPSIQSQGGVDQCLTQGPGHHGGDPPGLARVGQEKYGVRMLDEMLQPRHICPGRTPTEKLSRKLTSCVVRAH